MADPWTLGGGLLVGFASSLHCVGMCGGVTLMLSNPASSHRPHWQALAPHLGRIGAYMVLGGITGGLGAASIGGLGGASAHLLLRWASAMTLAWIGLAMLGLMPTPAIVGRFMLAHAPSLGHVKLVRAPASLRGVAMGVTWGLMPCGMVYGALLYAAFSGSAAGGMMAMAGFGMGTVPALLLVQSGSGGLARMARHPQLRMVAGLLLVLVAGLSITPSGPRLLALCGIGS